MNISHVALYCHDLEGTREFFLRFFEGKSGDLYHNPKTGFSSYFIEFPESPVRLEIMTRPHLSTDDTDPHCGYAHIAFSLDSEQMVDSLTDILQAEGYACISGPRTTGDGFYESVILGPENLSIELTV